MPTIQPIRITLGFRSGAVQFAQTHRIKTRLGFAFRKALNNFSNVMTAWAHREVPKHTGDLITDFVNSVTSGPGQDAFVIGNPGISYASYVDRMSGVNWTKFGRNPSKDHYFQRAKSAMAVLIDRAITHAIRDEGLDLKTGVPASQLLTQLFRFS